MNATATDPLREWHRKVTELGSLWRSVRIACICMRDEHGWINLSGCLELSLKDPTGAEARPVVEVDALVALSGVLPVDTLTQLVSSLETGHVPTGNAYYPVRLSPGTAASGHWMSLLPHDRPYCKRDLGVDFTSLVCEYSGPDMRQLIPYGLGKAIDGKLRVGDHPFDGVDGLAQSLSLRPLGERDLTAFQCVAPIPLRFGSITHDLHDRCVSITVEASATIEPVSARVNAFRDGAALPLGDLSQWAQGDGAKVPTLGNEPPAELSCYRKVVEIRPHTGSLRLILAYKDATVEQHDQFLSARDLWIRAAQFFDPGFERSKNLVAKSGSVGVSRFEAGVARLLTLAGFRVAWFGKESAERRPDILAFHEFTSGQKTFLLVECTERNPMNKIDEAASRANELRGWLDDASCRVIPAVFSAAGRKEVDLQAAFEQRVALAGADELTKIWNAVEDGGGVEQVLRLLTEVDLIEHPGLFPGLVG